MAQVHLDTDQVLGGRSQEREELRLNQSQTSPIEEPVSNEHHDGSSSSGSNMSSRASTPLASPTQDSQPASIAHPRPHRRPRPHRWVLRDPLRAYHLRHRRRRMEAAMSQAQLQAVIWQDAADALQHDVALQAEADQRRSVILEWRRWRQCARN